MAVVAVTGGTGTLGRHLVPLLRERGHDVRVLSRRASTSEGNPGDVFQGDVRVGVGLDRAFDGVDTIIHAASSPRRRARETEVEGARNVLAAAGPGCHVIYVSIVGVDRARLPYYRAKFSAENLVERHEGAWTIQRATQFHELLDQLLSAPVFVRTKHMAFQPVAASDVAAAIASRVEAGPAGRAPDLGGPEVLGMRQLAAARRATVGRAARLLALPALGPLADFDAGHHLAPDHTVGTVTWEQWLRDERGHHKSSQ